MIASLRGILIYKDAQSAVVECGGVGYGLSMSATSLATLGGEGSEVSVVVHTHLTQDSLRLFGFVDRQERRIFEVLISISGVGPKLALAILSILNPGELGQVVAREDKATLVRIPGIGGKTAERLLVELKHRLPKIEATASSAFRPATRSEIGSDLAAALVALGFKPTAAEDVAKSTLGAHLDEKDLAVLVRLALRSTTRG
ncbi:MAG: Holliday junction DNA helicase RuvA [Deltaproteobacteria bacterium RIFOXYA12_FULL_58_15]|nr:MAG: Holliday junction DNA helicase RuvA [Deltaproteobacteria bacterium RIFOXYA12_FULL_58_15]OGR11565.1 MAG: Holliday junction DNA helicase RuvA [Deltaproteobacteria bacterium RIFOXYB12_FULL_58_9]